MFKILKRKVDLMQKVNLKQKVGLKTKVLPEIAVLTIGGIMLYIILILGALLLTTGTVFTITHREVNATALIDNAENSAPVIISNTDYRTNKTTKSFTIKMSATDEDSDNLDYTLYYKEINETQWRNAGNSKGIEEGTDTTISVTGLSEYTAYDWYIEVTDGKETVKSAKQTLRTYCSGKRNILYPIVNEIWETCTICNGNKIIRREGECSGTFSESDEIVGQHTSTTPGVLDSCHEHRITYSCACGASYSGGTYCACGAVDSPGESSPGHNTVITDVDCSNCDDNTGLVMIEYVHMCNDCGAGTNSLENTLYHNCICEHGFNEQHDGCDGDCTEEKDDEIAATCTETGLTEGSHCIKCNITLKAQEVIPATGHTWTAANCTEARKCSACGTKDGAALGHNYNSPEDNGDGTHTKVCERCEDEKTDEHTEEKVAAVAPTCEEEGLTEGTKCSECGAIIKEQTKDKATGHKITSWNDNKNGTHTGECDNCNKDITEECEYGVDNICDKCGYEKDTSCKHTYIIDKAGATQTQHWEKCTKCSEIRNIEKHTFENGICIKCDYECKHPNTTQKNNETHHWDECDDCGKELNKEEHDYENGKCKCGREEDTKPCEHPNTIPKQNETHHWDECDDCGAELNKEEHKYINGKCKCGKKDPSASGTTIPDTGATTTTIAIISLIGLAIIGVIMLIKYKEI